MLPGFITERTTSWEYLKSADKPIFIYGMGDGAVKILNIFAEKGIAAAGFFASDEFVRGHSFMGHLVHSLSQIEEQVEDFIIVLAFGAGYESLYDKINRIAEKHTLIAPDVPVYGGGLFDLDFCAENCDKLCRVYELLADDISRQTFADVINYKISGRIEYLNRCTMPREEIFRELIDLKSCRTYIDMGAYNGDTVLEFAELTGGSYDKIYAVEPDSRNFRKLTKNTEGLHNVELYNGAAWSDNSMLTFSDKSGRQSAIDPFKTGKIKEIQGITGDSLTEHADYIKMDVEGAEHEAILGARKSLENGAALTAALYHRNEDMFDIPLLVHEINPRLKLYVRHQLYIPAWETNLIAMQ
ncbi:MAG: FkbM family methyltransferase [Oscillospiraceae bacterium]|nr:FkbM family methyltransferase [Oscillospiraceae bacterium]MDY2848331.1 FkbM family methyltransferase [Oscillospiraceae bacterium]